MASEKPDGKNNYINLHDVMTYREYDTFRSHYRGKTITVELTFKDDVVKRYKTSDLTHIYNIKDFRVIAHAI